MTKYNVEITLSLTVEAGDHQWARSAVVAVFEDSLVWRNSDVGFSQSRFKIECKGVKLGRLRRVRTQ